MSKRTFFYLVYADYLAQLQGRSNFGDRVAAILFGRGLHTLLSYRLQKLLIKIPVLGKFIAKILRYFSCAFFACDISYYSEIDGGVYIPHPTGIVIGDQVKIGSGTTILQQVTLGTKVKQGKDYPTIGKNVYLGAGCRIIGAINLGDDVIVGANSVVIKSIPKGKKAVGVPARIINE